MKRSLLILFLSLCFITLSGFTVIGHRGEPSKAPEHSYLSYNKALADGADYIEQDLEISKDGVLVVSHDPSTKRTTNKNYVISNTNWNDLKKVRLQNNEPIHRLEDVFKKYHNTNANFMIETRLLDNKMVMEDKLIGLVKKYHLEKRVYFESFSIESLEKLHSLMPGVSEMLLNYNEPFNYKKLSDSKYDFIDAVSMRVQYANSNLVKTLHKAHKKVVPYDNFSENISASQSNRKKYDGFFTNYAGVYKSKNKSLEAPDNVYIKKRKRVKMYDSPFKKDEYKSIDGKKTVLKTNSSWKVNYALRGLDNEIYYDLGSSQWVRKSDVKEPTIVDRIWHKWLEE